MAFLDFLFGKGEQLQQVPRFTEQQQTALSQLLQGAQQGLPGGLNFLQSILGQTPEAMKQFEAPAMRQFEEEILPSIAERFTGQLGEGAQRSSAFGQQLGQAGAGLSERLGAQRAGLGSQALQQLMQILGTGLTPQFETLFRPRQPGFLEEGTRGALQNLPLLMLMGG